MKKKSELYRIMTAKLADILQTVNNKIYFNKLKLKKEFPRENPNVNKVLNKTLKFIFRVV